MRYELFIENSVGSTSAYGIMIKSSLPYDNGSVFVRDITESEELAKELFDRVVAYVVTPCELMFVVEDFIYEKYCI